MDTDITGLVSKLTRASGWANETEHNIFVSWLVARAMKSVEAGPVSFFWGGDYAVPGHGRKAIEFGE